MDIRKYFTGGEPDVRLDQILFGSDSNYQAIQSILKSYAIGTNPNFIISGCNLVVGGVTPSNTWTLSAGFIFLNSEIVEVENQSGTFDSTTQYLAFSKSVTYRVDGDKTFINGTPRQTLQQNRGIITVKSSVTIAELDAINGDHLYDKLKIYLGDASDSNKGVVEKATTYEAQTGVADKYIDAALLQQVTSTTTRAGIVEKATQTEFLTGVSDKNVTAELLGGTAWQTPSYNPGFSAGSESLWYRISNNKLEFSGEMNATAASGIAFTIPASYRPVTIARSFFTAGATGSFFLVNTLGEVASTTWATVGTNTFNSIIIKD